MKAYLIILWFFLNILDVIFTRFLLSNGHGSELTPLWAYGNWPLVQMLGIKLLLSGLVLIVVYKLPRLLKILNYGMGGVVAWNFIWILVSLGG